jgi:hypothetical protein
MSNESPVKAFFGRLGKQGGRVAMLLGLLVVSGVAIGLVASYPLQYVKFDESSAARLDQARLAGQVPIDQALVAAGDLPNTWAPGDPAAGAFGILGASFCGEQVDTPTPLSERSAAVFTNSTDQTTVIGQALRVDRWQSARSYISDVSRALGQCSEFYRTGPGTRFKVKIKDASGKPPIADDYVSAAFVNEDGKAVLEWSMFAVGDVIIAIQHLGPTRPNPPTFLNDLEQKVLVRIDPKDFAPGGIATETTLPGDTTPAAVGTGSTVLDSGSADETGGNNGAGAAGPTETTVAPATTVPARTPTTAKK